MSLMQKLAFAVMGQTLPNASAFPALVKELRYSLMAIMVAGILTAATILTLIYGFYHYLVAQGLAESTAYLVSAGALIGITLITSMSAQQSFRSMLDRLEKLNPLHQESSDSAGGRVTIGSTIDTTLQAFLDGFLQEEPTAKTEEDTTSSTKIALVKSEE